MGEDEEHRSVLGTGAGPDVHGSDAGEAPAGAPTCLTARQMYAPSNGVAPLRAGRCLISITAMNVLPLPVPEVHDDVRPLHLLQKLLLRRPMVVDAAGDALDDVVDEGDGPRRRCSLSAPRRPRRCAKPAMDGFKSDLYTCHLKRHKLLHTDQKPHNCLTFDSFRVAVGLGEGRLAQGRLAEGRLRTQRLLKQRVS